MTTEELPAQTRTCPECTPARYCEFHAAANRSIALRRAVERIEAALFANLTLEEKLAASVAVAEVRAGRAGRRSSRE